MGACLAKKQRRNGIPRRDPVDASALKRGKGLVIFVIGGPGAGKFALGRRLAAKYGFQLVSPSDMLRSEVEDEASERGRRFEEIMRQGRHVPADVIVQLVVEKMMTRPNAVGFLLVGFPRDRRQAKAFNEAVKRPNLVLNLCARRLILTERMRARVGANARFDDTPEIVCKRIKKYYETVGGAIAPNREVTTMIDAEKDEDEVFESACAAVDRVKDTV